MPNGTWDCVNPEVVCLKRGAVTSQTKRCPKCGSEMVRENYLSGYGAVRLVKFGDVRGDKIIPFYCKNCGYVELYNEKNLRK